MPFSLCNAPNIFQLAITSLLQDIPRTKYYLDDILIYDKDPKLHYEHVVQVIERLQSKGISINFQKSQLNKQKLKYLGHVIDEQGRRPDTGEVLKMFNFVPKTQKHLMRLSGFINWFRPYLSKLSEKTLFLTEKIGKGKSVNWSLQDANQTKNLLNEILECATLYHPHFNEIFYIDTDANEKCIGGIVYQSKDPIGFYSKKLSSCERAYTIQEKEALAVVKTVEHFRYLLQCTKIVIKIDNKNLLSDKNIQNSRSRRWMLALQEFDIKIKHCSGSNNTGVDFISRLYYTPFGAENLEIWKLKSLADA